MASGGFYLSTSSTTSSGDGIQGYVSWSESEINTQNNTSKVTVNLECSKILNYYTWGTWSYEIYINGKCVADTTWYGTVYYSWTDIATVSATVTHDSDGGKKTSIYAYISGPSGTSMSGRSSSGSDTVTLSTIPRSSSISSAVNVTLGDACSIQWTPASSSFKYKLKFELGSFSYTTGDISPGTTSAYTYSGYTIPLSVANYITNSTTATMAVYLYTYNGSTQIGSTASKTFTVTVPSSVVPTLSSFSVSPDNSANSVIKGWGLYVAGYSKVKLTAAAAGSYGSTISSFAISGGYSGSVLGSSLSFTGDILSSSGSKTFSVVAYDSRGRGSTSKSASITVYAYSTPQISSFTASRSSSSATSVSVKASWTFASVNGKNSASATLLYKQATSSGWTTYGSISSGSAVTLSLSETSSYDFKVIVTDAVGNTAQATAGVSTIDVLLDLRAGGKGLGIGKIAEKDAMEVALETEFTEDVKIYAKSSTDANSGLLQLYRDDKTMCAYLTTHDDGSGLRLHLYDANGAWKTYFRFTTDGQLIVPSLATDSISKISSTGTPFLAAYPIGSIYMSVNSTSPASFIGGTWERIKDVFLLAAGDTYAAGATGGEAEHTLTVKEMPSHNHGDYIELATNPSTKYYASGSYYGDYYRSTAYTGGGQAHNNMPPYLAVYMWKRTG